MPLSVHEYVVARAREAPESVAIVDGDRSVTYRELEARTNRLAHRLRRAGVTADDAVIAYLERSAELVIGVVAIHKASGAYVPLDPAYPPALRAQLAEHAAARCVLTTHATWAAKPIVGATPVFADDPIEESDAALAVTVHPDQRAYALFTSGPDGPKAIEMSHRALARLLDWQIAQLPKARVAQYGNFQLDVAFHDIYGTLATGGTLVIVPDALRIDVFAICGFLRDQRIERIYLPVVAVIEMGEAVRLDAPVPAALRDVISSGDQLRLLDSTRALFEQLGARLHNHYGVAETHLALAAALREPLPDAPELGRPIAGVRAYVLDEALREVPDGVAGELYLGGDLARGYRKLPAHTAERFVPDPFSTGARMVRTGDLVVRRADGSFEFRGRADAQLKLLGFRVEPSHVERVLASHPDVSAAAVIAIRDKKEDVRRSEQRLVAFVVAKPSPDLSRALQRHCKDHLPDFMVPAFYHRVEHIDRAALPGFATQLARQPALEGARIEPRTATEKVLRELWSEVLDVENIGIEDDFLMLGGNSLRAIRMIAQLRDLLDYHLTLRALLESTTISAVSARINRDALEAAAVEERAELVLRIAQMSDEEVAALLAE